LEIIIEERKGLYTTIREYEKEFNCVKFMKCGRWGPMYLNLCWDVLFCPLTEETQSNWFHVEYLKIFRNKKIYTTSFLLKANKLKYLAKKY